MIKTLNFLLALLLLVSLGCSTGKKEIDHSGFAAVDMDALDDDEKVQPLINVNREGTGNNSEMGEAKKVVGLVFGPGMNRTVGYVPLVKHLKNNNISYHVLMGSGVGAIFAAYIALGETHNKIEWEFHQMIKELEGKKPYGPEWIETLDKKILVKFKGKKIQELDKLLLIPLYDTRKDQISYFYRGDLYLALKYNFQLLTKKEGQKYLSGIKSSPYMVSELDRFGVDNWFGFDTLGDDLSFERVGDDYLIGVLGQLISTRETALKDYDGFYQLPMSDMPLDSVKNIPRYLKYADNKAKQIALEMKEVIKN